MPKTKRSKTQRESSRCVPRHSRPTVKPAPATSKAALQAAPPPPTIPFSPEDRILLVGEGEFSQNDPNARSQYLTLPAGDFSFAHSLLTHHACTSLLATSYDSRPTLLGKYPQAASYIEEIEDEDQKILYGVDATKLGKAGGGGKEVKRGGWERIVFNFPHVGGMTKDVNRQVRHNQELLVGFFTSALPLLAPSGSIIVTVFEGEPYELWNVRDLARHVGLKVGRSFKFQSRAYPGYKHARTLGNIEGGGGWKGEDRSARTYILERKDAAETRNPQKRKNGTSNVDDSDD